MLGKICLEREILISKFFELIGSTKTIWFSMVCQLNRPFGWFNSDSLSIWFKVKTRPKNRVWLMVIGNSGFKNIINNHSICLFVNKNRL